MSQINANVETLSQWREEESIQRQDLLNAISQSEKLVLANNVESITRTPVEVFSVGFASELSAMEKQLMSGDTTRSGQSGRATKKLAALMSDCIQTATQWNPDESVMFARQWGPQLDSTQIIEQVDTTETTSFTFNTK